jgi:hypothetical protein
MTDATPAIAADPTTNTKVVIAKGGFDAADPIFMNILGE